MCESLGCKRIVVILTVAVKSFWREGILDVHIQPKPPYGSGILVVFSCSDCCYTQLVMMLERDPGIVSCMGGYDTVLGTVGLSKMSKMSKGQQVQAGIEIA